MKKVTFIVFIALNICLIVLGIIMFFIKYTSAIRYSIVGLSFCYIYFIGWLLGYDAGSIDEKNKKQGEDHLLDALEYAKKVCDNEEQAKHDSIAQIVETQRLYAQSKDKKVCKKCVNCKNYISKITNTNGESYSCSFCKWGNADIVRNVNWFTSCKHFEARK